MTLPALSACIIAGILPLLWLPALPDIRLVWWVLALGCLFAYSQKPVVRYCGFTLLFFVWGILAAQQTLWPTQHLSGGNRHVEVILTETDNMTRHQGKILRLDGVPLYPAPGITFYGEYLPRQTCSGQRWAMTIRARPVHGQLNEGGFDSQRYALASHQPLSGRIIHARILDARCSWRAGYLQSLTERLVPYAWQPVILALGMGERSALNSDVKNAMRQTGTAHLMAISGLHIALASMLVWLIVRAVQFFLPVRWIDWRLPLLLSVGGAIGYAWLTGLQPPALRTAVALSVWAALRLSGRLWSPWQVWLCCVAAILFTDPLAVLSDSLWLSAFAVASLLFWYQWLPIPGTDLRGWVRGCINLVYLQAGMTLLLLPIQLSIFHGISLTSLVANLAAIPLVTFVAVPFILLGMVLHLTGPSIMETVCWYVADNTLEILFSFLRWLPPGWLNVDMRWQWLAWVPWCTLMAWRLNLWRTMPAVCLACLVILAFPFWRSERSGEWSVHMLDVGHGLALVIERDGKAILYDTGSAWPGGDSGQQLIIPWLRWHALEPEGVILSHEHLDHRGGLNSLLNNWPGMWVRSPLGWAGHHPCFRGEKWQWQGLNFSVHWPLQGSTAQGNNRSCVVRVDDGQNSILLTGDIEAQGEMAMLSHYWEHLASTLVQVPHHGSNTSSTLPFIQRIGGNAALASASRYNAWRLPSAKVTTRYRQQGYRWFDTAHQGQTTIAFSAQGWEIHSLRDQLLPRWYHQWFGVPSDNR
ncbi:competence protein ComEC [Kosakonia oryzendophytica]|uniref:Competence protein ComEC n=1 Tax=Kosakonia oryzendophytica TaxID=1005665 RepID=A0A1C4D810_9ENTR|nr:ComEC family protein [Kosakonia oryzendophytica]SCC27545.1 competence protein ComEC [Kosakonia oryzendophytica]